MSQSQLAIPVEVFERFMLDSQSPGFPMSFAIELQVAEEVSRESLECAIRSCAVIHPLLFSTLDSSWRNWCFRPDLWDGVRLFPADSPGESLKFDLTSQIGIRVFYSDNDDASHTLVFVFHHACVDGLGAIQFLRDVSRAYEDVAATTLSRSKQDDATVVRQLRYLRRFRRSYGGNRLWSLFQWPGDCVGMLWSFEMLWNRPIALAPTKFERNRQESAAGKWGTGIGNRALSLDSEVTQRIKDLAKVNQQTLNDRVLECWFRALAEWMNVFAPNMESSLLRVLVPMNLRRGAVASAANMVAMVNFDRKVMGWRSRVRFRRFLRAEMRVVKWIRGGRIANRFLQVQRLLLGDWPMLRNPERCLTTSVLSNLGDIGAAMGKDRNNATFAGQRILGLSVLAPLRPQCHVFLSLFSWGGNLTLNFTWNPHYLDDRHLEFLEARLQAYLLTEDPWAETE